MIYNKIYQLFPIHILCRIKFTLLYLSSNPSPNPTAPKLLFSPLSTNLRKPKKKSFKPNTDKLSKKELNNPSSPGKKKRKKHNSSKKWWENPSIFKNNIFVYPKPKSRNKSKNSMNLTWPSDNQNSGSDKLSSPFKNDKIIKSTNKPSPKNKEIKSLLKTLRNVSFSLKRPIGKECLKEKRKASKESRNSDSPGYFSLKRRDKEMLRSWKRKFKQKPGTSKSISRAKVSLLTVEQEWGTNQIHLFIMMEKRVNMRLINKRLERFSKT